MNSGRRRWRRIALVLLLLIAAGVGILLRSTEWLASLGGRPEGARLARIQHSPQFADGRFRNREQRQTPAPSNREMFRRQFFGKEQREPAGPIPVVARTASDYKTAPASGLRATWIGWATVLVEIDGHVLLTDPIWSERCSPSTLVGPKRFHPPPIALSELPRVDAVVISHDHYDHLDMSTIRALAAGGTHFAVPLGVGAHLERWGVAANQIHELDWNESFDLHGLSMTATPARHYSGRNPRHRNETLWASWVVKGPQHRIFFSGDSGYTDQFRTIGAQYGPFDLTLVKIGASDPTWADIHMTPEEAIRTHLDVRGRVMLPVHWATFNLGFHAWREPADRAVAAAAKAGVTLIVPKPGAFVEPAAAPPPREVWWNLAPAVAEHVRDPEWESLVSRAVETGELPFPRDLAPAAVVLDDSRPPFTWPAREHATYIVSVFDGEFLIAHSESLSVPRWRPGTDLPRGRTLTWQVEVPRRDTTEVIPAPPATFRITSALDHRELANAKASRGDDDLLLAVLSARSGLREEARAALRRAAAKGDPAARKLLERNFPNAEKSTMIYR